MSFWVHIQISYLRRFQRFRFPPHPAIEKHCFSSHCQQPALSCFFLCNCYTKNINFKNAPSITLPWGICLFKSTGLPLPSHVPPHGRHCKTHRLFPHFSTENLHSPSPRSLGSVRQWPRLTFPMASRGPSQVAGPQGERRQLSASSRCKKIPQGQG